MGESKVNPVIDVMDGLACTALVGLFNVSSRQIKDVPSAARLHGCLLPLRVTGQHRLSCLPTKPTTAKLRFSRSLRSYKAAPRRTTATGWSGSRSRTGSTGTDDRLTSAARQSETAGYPLTDRVEAASTPLA